MKVTDYAPALFQPGARGPKTGFVLSDAQGRYLSIGPRIATTWASTSATCPHTCPFHGAGCYAEGCSWLVHALNAAARAWTGAQVNRYEAHLMDTAFGGGSVRQDGGRHGDAGRDLRLHIAGDFADARGLAALVGAADRWRVRDGGVVYAPTHRQRELPVDSFGPIQIMGSCETARQVEETVDLGFAAELTVREFPFGHREYRIPALAGLRFVPCPEQATGTVRCVTCRLCMDTARLRRQGIVIVFALHPTARDRAKAKRHLPVLDASPKGCGQGAGGRCESSFGKHA